MKSKKNIYLLILIFLLAFIFRFCGINWDQDQHLHPDERFLTMVVADSDLPKSLFNYFDSSKSPLNPKNNGYDFYAYGDLPVTITCLLGHILNLNNYDKIYLIGRLLSIILDSSIILIIFFFGKLLKIKNKITIIACFFYALSILPIQLAHFFTVDPFLVFFNSLAIYFFVKFLKNQRYRPLIFSAFFFGVALSCKTSVIVTAPLFIIFIFFKSSRLHRFFDPLIFILFIFISFRVFNPYAFDGFLNLSPEFIQSINMAHQMVTGEYNYPPNIQWLSTIPFVHPFINIFFFGLGPIVTILFLIGFKKSFKFNFIFWFIVLIFLYQGIQLAKYMRYFYPIYPFLCLIAALGFESFSSKKIFSKLILISIIISPLFFINIYTNLHSRVQASFWLNKNLKDDSSIGYEYWDDALPLSVNSQPYSFNLQHFSLFDIEDEVKLENFYNELSKVDYFVLSSNRFWRSISQNTDKYPNAALFYQKLFNSQLEFKQIKTFYSYPGLELPFLNRCFLIGLSDYPSQNNSFFEINNDCDNPGIYFRDNLAEESFTVYDHPQVFVFSRL